MVLKKYTLSSAAKRLMAYTEDEDFFIDLYYLNKVTVVWTSQERTEISNLPKIKNT